MDAKKERKTPQFISTLVTTLKSPRAIRLSRYPINFVLGFLLSRGIILGTSAPFGLALTAALGTARGSIGGLIGSVLGYLSILDNVNSLKYIACMILIFTAHFVFSETSLVKHRSFTPLSVLIPMLCVNFVFVADGGFRLFDTALSIFEVCLTAICAVFFSYIAVTPSKSPKELSGGLLIFSAVLIVPLSSIRLFGFLSLGKAIAFCLVLLAAYNGGVGVGTALGTIFGVFVSLATSSADFCMIYGIYGLCAAVNAERKLFFASVSASLFALFIAVCLNPTLLIPTAAELAVGAVSAIPLCGIFSRYVSRFLNSEKAHHDMHLRAYTSERLSLAANAFKSLGTLLGETRRRTINQQRINTKDVFDNTIKNVCRNCNLSSICWKRDFESTKDAMTNAESAAQKNGTLYAKDFPIYFSSRCLHIEEIINNVNREIFSDRFRRQYDGRLRESHELLTKQYSDVSAIFSSLSSDISDINRFDEEAEMEIRAYLASRGILCETAVYRDFEGHLNIHLCGKDLKGIASDFERFRPAISSAAKTSLAAPQYTETELLDDILIREMPRFKAMFGASVRRKRASDISGDSGSFFRPSNSHVALLLADGMGSGKLAAHESATSIKLLEGLLKSGISPQSALETLQSALSLKNEYSGAFSTLDLAYIDVFSGVCDVYKFGAAPTYIKRGRKIRRITSSSLPMGVNVGQISSPDKTTLFLEPGDFLIMTSDGATDENNDAKFLEFLSASKESTPKALADSLLAYSLSVYEKNDDTTIAVILISPEE